MEGGEREAIPSTHTRWVSKVIALKMEITGIALLLHLSHPHPPRGDFFRRRCVYNDLSSL